MLVPRHLKGQAVVAVVAVVSLQVDKALVQHLIDLVNGGKILICLSVAWRLGWIAQNTELMGGSTICIQYIYSIYI